MLTPQSVTLHRMKPVILFRQDLDADGEMSTAALHLPVVPYRSQVPPGSLVIARYSALPFYGELERELALGGSVLANTHRQHRWIAELFEWGSAAGGVLVEDGLTPRSWDNWAGLPEGAYVLKGRTNSRKSQWATPMYAPTRADIPRVAARLLDDGMVREQGIVVREYVPLRMLAEGLNGLPVTNEWRVFYWADAGEPVFLAAGYYWRGTHPETEALARFTDEARVLAERAAALIAPYARFFVLDVAEKASGGWMVVEVNDGQMSGPGGVDFDTLYRALARVVGPPAPGA